MQSFRELRVWKKAHEVTLAVYKATHRFPKNEVYGLSSQTRRSAASICANVAEGCGRGTRKEFAHFLNIAMGSASELEYHLTLAADLGIIDRSTYHPLAGSVTDVKRMLAGLIRKLREAQGTTDHRR